MGFVASGAELSLSEGSLPGELTQAEPPIQTTTTMSSAVAKSRGSGHAIRSDDDSGTLLLGVGACRIGLVEIEPALAFDLHFPGSE